LLLCRLFVRTLPSLYVRLGKTVAVAKYSRKTVLIYLKSNVAKLKRRLLNTDLPLCTPSLSVGLKGSGKPCLRIHNFVI
jgi:hypothetical protein